LHVHFSSRLLRVGVHIIIVKKLYSVDFLVGELYKNAKHGELRQKQHK
jgi:hypothetical protein